MASAAFPAAAGDKMEEDEEKTPPERRYFLLCLRKKSVAVFGSQSEAGISFTCNRRKKRFHKDNHHLKLLMGEENDALGAPDFQGD